MVGVSSQSVDHHLAVKFVSAGTAACIADIATFPLDVAKVRLQIQGESSASGAKKAANGVKSSKEAKNAGSPKISKESKGIREMSTAVVDQAKRPQYRGLIGTIVTIAKHEGPRSLYNGLIPGLQRQMCFASIRIGFYDHVKQFYLDHAGGKTGMAGTMGIRILAGITTGGLAVSVAQPTDVVKVRMQAQSGGKKRYKSALHAYKTIAREEGVRGLWKGILPNITRNAIVNAAELVCYDTIKEALLSNKIMSDNMPCHFVSGFGAGFMATVVVSPVDVVKTRFMNAPVGQYRGAIDAAIKMYKEGGPKAFYKGFVPSFMRISSWNIFMFVTYEQLKRLISTYHDRYVL